jgi:hypothetical protein
MGVGLEVNMEKTKYMFMHCHQNARQNHDIKTANKFLKKCGKVQIYGNVGNKSKLYSQS